MNQQQNTLGQNQAKARELTSREKREQARHNERIAKEANQVLNQLKDRFSSYFFTCENPDSEETQARIKTISAQWKGFCRRKNLLPKFFTIVDEFCNEILEE